MGATKPPELLRCTLSREAPAGAVHAGASLTRRKARNWIKSEIADFLATMEPLPPRQAPSHAQFSTPLADPRLDRDPPPSRIRENPTRSGARYQSHSLPAYPGQPFQCKFIATCKRWQSREAALQKRNNTECSWVKLGWHVGHTLHPGETG